MNLEEAEAWLKGERSTINYAQGDTPQDAQERATRMDAAMTEQAYWVVRSQGLERNKPRVLESILVGLLAAVVLMAVVVYFQL